MDFGTSVTAGVIIMYLQSQLKHFDFYKRFIVAFPAADKYVHRIVAGFFSFCAALGITYVVTGDAATGWHVGFDIPNQAALVTSVFGFIKSFVTTFTAQQVAYDTTRRPAVMPHDQPAAEPKK